MTDVLQVLPFVYDLGARRAAAEIRHADQADDLWLLPVVGFLPLIPHDGRLLYAGHPDLRDDADAAAGLSSYLMLRLNLAVLDQVLLSVRLPDIVCSRSARSTEEGQEAIEVEKPATVRVHMRYLPKLRRVSAEDMTVAIVNYLAGTCEGVADEQRRTLRDVERRFSEGAATAGGPGTAETRQRQTRTLTEAFRDLQAQGETVEFIERQIAKVLRRLADDETKTPARRRPTLQYREEVAELRSLQTELRLAGETMASVMSVRQLEEAQSQQARSDRLQRVATLITSLVLVPALVAALYGANVKLPGDESWAGLAALVFFMFGTGLSTWWFVRARESDNYWLRRVSEYGSQLRPLRQRHSPAAPGEVDREMAKYAFMLNAAFGIAIFSLVLGVLTLVLYD